MFRMFVTLATLITTGAHALFGCCLHHEHAAHNAVCQVEPSAKHEAAKPACGCRHACKNEPHDEAEETGFVALMNASPCEPSGKHDSGECRDGRCQFLPNAKVEMPSLDSPNAFAGVAPSLDLGRFVGTPLCGTPTGALSASLLSGSFSIADLTQILRI